MPSLILGVASAVRLQVPAAVAVPPVEAAEVFQVPQLASMAVGSADWAATAAMAAEPAAMAAVAVAGRVRMVPLEISEAAGALLSPAAEAVHHLPGGVVAGVSA